MIGSWIRRGGNVRRTRIRLTSRLRASATSGDGRHDRHHVGLLQGRLLTLQEADVLLVHVDVDEAAQLAALVDEAFLETGELPLEVGDDAVHRIAGGLHLGMALRDLTERRRDPDRGHGGVSSQLVCVLRLASAWSNADSDGLIATCADSLS